MTTKITTQKNYDYGVIQRGASLTIPVTIKDTYDNPFYIADDYEVSFTVKAVQTDFDYKDMRAYIQKDFVPQDPANGIFYIELSSADTDFPPGQYFFDIELVSVTTGVVYRLATLYFTLDGGPTNRRVNAGIGQLPVGSTISFVTLEQGNPIVVVAPATISTSYMLVVDQLEQQQTLDDARFAAIEAECLWLRTQVENIMNLYRITEVPVPGGTTTP